MSSLELKNAVLPALLTGVRGRSLPQIYGATESLQLLAFTAQAVKLDRPQPPESFIVEDETTDARKVVPDEARTLIQRLAGPGVPVSAGGRMLAALAREIAGHGLKLHPFDLPLLESFVERHAEVLGAEAMTFVQRDAAPEERRSYFDAEAMTDDTWINGNRGERAKYVARRRAEDPETALALVEAEWSGLDVESKVRLVSALRVRSNPSDVPFLRTLLKERSPRIKDAARALLARLPGYAGDNPNLREAVSRIERRRGDPSSFDLRLPSNVSQYGADQWIVSTFTGFGVGELAEALGTAPEQLVTAAVPDERLLCGIMVSATSDARFDIVSEITENFLHAKQDFMILNEIHGTEQLTPSERLQWLAAALRPRQWAEVSSVALERISDMLEDFLPADMAGAVFESAAMKRFLLAGRLGVDHFEMLAAMCPRELRAELMAMLAPHVPRAETAILFLELMNILEK